MVSYYKTLNCFVFLLFNPVCFKSTRELKCFLRNFINSLRNLNVKENSRPVFRLVCDRWRVSGYFEWYSLDGAVGSVASRFRVGRYRCRRSGVVNE